MSVCDHYTKAITIKQSFNYVNSQAEGNLRELADAFYYNIIAKVAKNKLAIECILME